jgi:hypothetical protein
MQTDLIPWDGKSRMTRHMAMIRSDILLGRLVRYHPSKILQKDDVPTEPVDVPILESAPETNVVPLPVPDPANEVLSRRPSIKLIMEQVASFYGMTLVDLCSHRRSLDIVRPRQVAMWLCRRLTLRSLPEIGRVIGGRDHTTVLHGCRTIDRLLQCNGRLADEVHIIKLRIAQKLFAEAA